MRRVARSSLFMLLLTASALAVPQAGEELGVATMYVRGDTPDSCRLDVYVAVPYSLLQFAAAERSFLATYRLDVTVRDSVGRRLAAKSLERTLSQRDATIARGASDAADITQTVFTVPPGSYRVEIVVSDKLSNRQWRTDRRAAIPDWSRQQIGVSGVLIVSRIEERNRRYVITPYVGDDISSLGEGFFVFFEAYSPPSRQLWGRCRVLDSNQSVYATSWQQLRTDSTGRVQHFLRIVLPTAKIPQGQYRIAVEVGTDTNRIVATSERRIELRYGVSSSVFTDIGRAIRQLRYIATEAEIDSMLAKPTDAERRAAFEQFWKEHDPTPGTLRNEAFEEYYARIEYANRNFRSYTEGWLTDMGMVYIVLGEPSSVERRINPYDNRSIIIWTYSRLNRRYVFVDNTGFGDYRLSPTTPFFLSEKYRYSGLQ
ncbi:MAG: GWxTD domain-containing protein [Chlorobi bacterium]|nr:GWxTD domain-containing protein [Chlorobiota bacterium]